MGGLGYARFSLWIGKCKCAEAQNFRVRKKEETTQCLCLDLRCEQRLSRSAIFGEFMAKQPS
jgi:hypothetical protein